MIELWYTFKHKIFPRFVARIAKVVLEILTGSCRYEVEGLETYLATARSDKCVVMLWHHHLLLAPKIFTKFTDEFSYAALVSQSRDGEILAAIINSYRIGSSIRVAHNAKKSAMDGAIQYLDNRKGLLIITPDGPKGPPKRMKKGTVYIAKASGAKILPISWKCDKYWTLNTWDKMKIPKPFSKIQITFGEPVSVKEGKELPSKAEVAIVEEKLNALNYTDHD
jgi:lysophospholipid acyltransferase (LPLAT)-like uncharacterized protein